mgnify:FL=1
MTTVINVSLSVIVPLIALLYDIDSAINYARSSNKRGRLRILRAWAELHPFAAVVSCMGVAYGLILCLCTV